MHNYYFRLWAWLFSGYFLGIGWILENVAVLIVGLACLSICLYWEYHTRHIQKI